MLHAVLGHVSDITSHQAVEDARECNQVSASTSQPSVNMHQQMKPFACVAQHADVGKRSV